MPEPQPTAPREADDAAPPLELTYIRPSRGWVNVNWRELWDYRELLYFLTWRDIKVRYKQTVLGLAWAVLQPVVAMLIFTVIFGEVLGIPPEGFPYAVFVYAGLLPWTFFNTGVTQSALSLVNQPHLLTKVYFPRLFVPTAFVAGALVDLAISFAVYGVVLWVYGVAPSPGVVFVPVLLVLLVVTVLGIGFTLAALTAVYRDFRFVVPFMIQTIMYLSPVIYPVSKIPAKYHWLLALNPMTGIIDGFRSSILGKDWNWTTLWVSGLVGTALFVWGVLFFRRTEKRFADII